MTTIARVFLPLYGLLLVVGGLKGYQEGSRESLYAGAGSGVIALLLAVLSGRHPRLSLGLGALVASILTGVMGWRWEKSGKIVPAGVIAMTSLVATAVEAAGAIKAR